MSCLQFYRNSNLRVLMYYAAPDEILTRLEAGFDANSAHLKAVENELRVNVQRGRDFGAKHGADRGFSSTWNDIEEILQRIQLLADEIDQAPQGKHDQKDIEHALKAWKTLQAETSNLETELADLRDQVASLDLPARQEWNGLAETFEEELRALLVCAKALRIRLELQDGRSQEEVDQFIRDVLTELRERPRPENVDASTYELEYLKSAIEIAHEKQESLGFPVVIKTLFTWYENPEERVDRTLLVPID